MITTSRSLLLSGALYSVSKLSLICSVGLFASVLSPSVAEAAFYKCVDADGGVTYSSSQCPASEQIAKVIQGSTGRGTQDCRIARNFSQQVATMVASGASPNSAFNRYGGINALSPTTIGLINYLYTFKNSSDMSAARMSSLAVARCENSSFGSADCAQFPIGFISDLGGCEGALIPGGARYGSESSRIEQREASYAAAQQPISPAAVSSVDPRRTQQRRSERVEQCRTRLKEKIDTVNRRMRSATSMSAQDELRAKRHNLGRQLNQCS